MLAEAVEHRRAALAMLLDTSGAAAMPVRGVYAGEPAARIQAASIQTDRLIDQAETWAKTRADRLRLALRLAGLNPSAAAAPGTALGGPLIEAGDPKALATVLDVDEDFARRIQQAAVNMSDARVMTAAAAKLPFGQPMVGARRSSGFGARLDPFSRSPALHWGLDFSAPMRSPIYSAGPGTVSYVGPRNGYGTVVEIDHGGGFKTGYAHLSSSQVSVGQQVAVGQRIAAVGNTGRSTGPHLHYEVWVNGRVQNPDRFLKAGSYVHEVH